MARPRLELHYILSSIKGVKKCYYSPPNGLQMQYPCIIYTLNDEMTDYADNEKYKRMKQYSLTLIDENLESEIYDRILELPYCSLSNCFTSDNLAHFVYRLYF